MRTLVFGGTGRLGKYLKQTYDSSTSYFPTHQECDICNFKNLRSVVQKYNPEVIINAAALVGTKKCEQNKQLAWNINVGGVQNIVKLCRELKIRLIQVSSAAIFNGNKGLYKETDVPTPTFYYAITKVVGEEIVKTLHNFAIIRLDFFTDQLKYKTVFVDHYTSKIHGSKAAKKIKTVAHSDFKGIINIGQKKDSLFNILKPHFPNIEPIKIKQSSLPDFPKDISLDLSRWKKEFK